MRLLNAGWAATALWPEEDKFIGPPDLRSHAGHKVLVMRDEDQSARIGLQAGHKAADGLHVQVGGRLILHAWHGANHQSPEAE